MATAKPQLKIYISLFIVMAFAFILSVPLSLSSARKVTLDELQAFVLEDETDKKPYVTGVYNCVDFAEDIIEHAKQHDYRVGFVGIGIDNVHTIVCFDTTEGIYFLEPQFDLIFSEERMEEMKSRGIYDISIGYGFMREYFDYPFSNYYIDWR